MNTPRRPRPCEVCREQYVPTYCDQRTCGRLCGWFLRGCLTECTLNWRTCVCGNTYAKPGSKCLVCRVIPRPPRTTVSLVVRECESCGEEFMQSTSRQIFCAYRCKRRAIGQRRKVREAGSYGHWRWSDFMRIAARFDYCCAYCGDKPGQLDPDHVIPLAKGGPNTTSNLLPACQRCNGQKTDMLLHDWAAYRTARGLPPLRTSWDENDPRYFHLTALRSTLAA